MAIMAGMLAGADSARRRRQLRQAGPAADPAAVGSRRSSSSSSSSSLFSHTTKRSETHHSVATSQIIRSNNNNNNNNNNNSNNNYINRELHDWKLGSGAREAKERLDEKLRNQRTSVIRSRRYSMASVVGALQREIFSCRRKSTRRFTWSKLAWNKTAEAEAQPDHAATECAVCLEVFRSGDELTYLPCAHRFHRSCAVPWLEISPNCPFCRTCIFSMSK